MDSRNKRASALGIGLPFGRVAPNPDGSLAVVPDRQQLAYSYAAALAVVAASADVVILVRSWPRQIRVRQRK